MASLGHGGSHFIYGAVQSMTRTGLVVLGVGAIGDVLECGEKAESRAG